MPVSDIELWDKIQGYSMPRPTSRTRWFQAEVGDFESLLERDMNVSADDAKRLVQEYRKFLYLKALDGGLLTPPPDLDEVWHKHIECPNAAWDEFCRTVVGKPLEHRKGLSSEQARKAYDRALALYETQFGSRPTDIWPGPRENQRHRIGLALVVVGLALVFGGHLTFFAAAALGYPQIGTYWVFYTFFGGIGLFFLGAFFGNGTRVNRSNCG